MSVAESMVILAPIVQLGCLSASSGRACGHALGVHVAEGPARGGQDEPRDIVQVLTHEALPDGRVLGVDGAQPGQRRGHGVGRVRGGHLGGPALGPGASRGGRPTTSVSLLAVATTLPASSAASTGRRLTTPPVATITRSTSSRVAICDKRVGVIEPLGAVWQVQPRGGLGVGQARPRAAAAAAPARPRVSASRPAASATTSKSPVCAEVEHVDRLAADGAGRAEQGDARRRASPATEPAIRRRR